MKIKNTEQTRKQRLSYSRATEEDELDEDEAQGETVRSWLFNSYDCCQAPGMRLTTEFRVDPARRLSRYGSEKKRGYSEQSDIAGFSNKKRKRMRISSRRR